MDRWYWSQSSLLTGEVNYHTVSGIRLYDGEKKTSFDDGHLTVTNLRLLWYHSSLKASLALNLGTIIFFEEEPGYFTASSKTVLHLSVPLDKPSGPVSSSNYTFIKLSFRQGGSSNFNVALQKVLSKKEWECTVASLPTATTALNTKQLRAGILGIERDIQAKQRETSDNIGKAFEDLKNLMSLAKEMVTISKNIATKIKEQTGEISSDETVQLRSCLLSLGIDDPVTKEAVGSTTEYHKRLAQEICNALEGSVKDVGGVMLLSEVYCRINRARGLHLLSPEDVSNACTLMSSLKLSLRLFTFQSGVQVLQLSTLNEEVVSSSLIAYLDNVEEEGISASEYSRITGIPLLLAQERLYHAVRCAFAVKDESTEGLRFYPNLFYSRSINIYKKP